MFSENRLREAENTSSISNLKFERKGVVRLKCNALGDVQNTIHSRPANSGISNTNAFVKSLTQGKVETPRLQNENLIGKSNWSTKGEKIIKPSATESVYHDSTVNESDSFETHNHILCEQAEQLSVADLFTQYKLSESQIDNLVKSVKKLTMPVLKFPVVVPCTDIEIPKEETTRGCNNKFFNMSDIYSDLVIPDVPAPVERIPCFYPNR